MTFTHICPLCEKDVAGERIEWNRVQYHRACFERFDHSRIQAKVA